jgi:hypothetical protein
MTIVKIMILIIIVLIMLVVGSLIVAYYKKISLGTALITPPRGPALLLDFCKFHPPPHPGEEKNWSG